MKMRKWLALLVSLCLLTVLAGCSLFGPPPDPFAGKWIGLVKVPMLGRSVVQADIVPLKGEKGRYHVALAAEHYVPDGPGSTTYVWEPGASLKFDGNLDGDELQVNSFVKLSFLVGKATGTIRLHDGTVLYKDTGEQKKDLKKQLAEEIRKEVPGAVFRDRE
ncbi:MAG: hypothetical protein ACOYKB_05205 [Succiniclasticum sp.]|jgi:hypothetical protein